MRDIAGPALAPESLARLRALDTEKLPKLPDDVRLGPCVGGTRNVIAIGLNFADHAAETNSPIPAERSSSTRRRPACAGRTIR